MAFRYVKLRIRNPNGFDPSRPVGCNGRPTTHAIISSRALAPILLATPHPFPQSKSMNMSDKAMLLMNGSGERGLKNRQRIIWLESMVAHCMRSVSYTHL